MKVSVAGNGTNNYTEMDKNPVGFLVNVSATTVGDINLNVLEGVTINANLYRQKQMINIVSGNLFALGRYANPAGWNTSGSATPVKTNNVGFFVPFRGIINLKDGDSMNVSVQTSSAATGQTVTISTVYGTGVETVTPVIRVYPVNKTATLVPLACGDFVNTIGVVQTGTDHILTAINGGGKIWTCDYSTEDFNAMIANQWPRQPVNLSYVLYDGSPCDNTVLNLTINTGGSGNLYVVVAGGVSSPVVTARAINLQNRIVSNNKRRLGA